MGAAAAISARLQTRAEKMLSASERQQKIELKAGFSTIPNSYFDVLGKKCSSFVEYYLIGLILRKTYGGKDRLRWTVLTAQEAAGALIVSVEAAELALRAAESHGFIEARFFGRQKYYAACPDKFAAAPDKEQREIERKPAAAETELRAPQSKPVTLRPGERSEPMVLSESLRARYSNQCQVPISISAAQSEDGLFDFAFHDQERKGEEQANDTRTPVRLSKRNGVGNNGSQTSHPHQDIDAMREFLNRWCRERLGPVDDAIVLECLKARGAASLQDCAGRLRSRLASVSHATWKLVVLIIGDAAKAAGNVKRSTPVAGDEPKNPELEEAMDWAKAKGMPIQTGGDMNRAVEAWEQHTGRKVSSSIF